MPLAGRRIAGLPMEAAPVISTAHDMFLYLEPGETVWLRMHILDSEAEEAEPGDGQEGRREGAPCSLPPHPSVGGPTTAAGAEGAVEEGGFIPPTATGADPEVPGTAPEFFWGRTVWEEACVVWCDVLGQPEPEVQLRLLHPPEQPQPCASGRQPAQGASWLGPGSAGFECRPAEGRRGKDEAQPRLRQSQELLICARISDIELRHEVGEGSGGSGGSAVTMGTAAVAPLNLLASASCLATPFSKESPVGALPGFEVIEIIE